MAMLPIEELESLLPLIKEKEQQGLILPSYTKAVDLVQWHKRGRPFSEKTSISLRR